MGPDFSSTVLRRASANLFSRRSFAREENLRRDFHSSRKQSRPVPPGAQGNPAPSAEIKAHTIDNKYTFLTNLVIFHFSTCNDD
jgi:hypothetical protein